MGTLKGKSSGCPACFKQVHNLAGHTAERFTLGILFPQHLIAAKVSTASPRLINAVSGQTGLS